MNKITIRPMRPDDLDDVLQVELEAFVTPWSRQAFEEELTQNRIARYLVAESEGKVVGYAGVWFVIDEAHITNVAVHASARRQGVGRLLMEHLIGLAQDNGIGAVTLEVRINNTAARELYGKLGFVEKGIRPNYYSETKEDALILWREQK